MSQFPFYVLELHTFFYTSVHITHPSVTSIIALFRSSAIDDGEWKVPPLSAVLVWGWWCFWLLHVSSLITHTLAPFPSPAGGKPRHHPPEGNWPAYVKHTSLPVAKFFLFFFFLFPPRPYIHMRSFWRSSFLPALCRVWFAVWRWLASIFLLFSTIFSVPSFHLSICGRHLRCLAAVTEAHILIATRWGELAALTPPCTAGLRAHIHSGQMGSARTPGWCGAVQHTDGCVLTVLSLGSCVPFCYILCVCVCVWATVVISRCHMAYFPLTLGLDSTDMLVLRHTCPVLRMFELEEFNTTWCVLCSWSVFVQVSCSEFSSPVVFLRPPAQLLPAARTWPLVRPRERGQGCLRSRLVGSS